MSNYNEIMLIGEDHTNQTHSEIEAELIEDFKPDFILYEGFTDLSEDVIRKRIERDYNIISERIPAPLYKAMRKSSAMITGCDSSLLIALFNSGLHMDEENMADEKSDRLNELLEQINNVRENYMAKKIVQYSKKGKLLIILGAAHLKGVSNSLQTSGLEVEVRDLYHT